MPTLNKLFFELILSIVLSKNVDVIKPIVINKKQKKIIPGSLKLILKYLIDSGIKSRIETHIITADANEHDAAITLSLFLILKKIGIVPISVENPANVVRINGYNIKKSPSKFYVIKYKIIYIIINILKKLYIKKEYLS